MKDSCKMGLGAGVVKWILCFNSDLEIMISDYDHQFPRNSQILGKFI